MIVDPYFNGEAFDTYLSATKPEISVQILADRYAGDIKQYIEKHTEQYKTKISLKRSKELHDRLVFIDGDIAWIMGGSIKDAGKKATYLIPLASPLAIAKKEIYTDLWEKAKLYE